MFHGQLPGFGLPISRTCIPILTLSINQPMRGPELHLTAYGNSRHQAGSIAL